MSAHQSPENQSPGRNDPTDPDDPRRRKSPEEPPTTPDGNPPRPGNPLSTPDKEIKEPPPGKTPTPVETPNEDK